MAFGIQGPGLIKVGGRVWDLESRTKYTVSWALIPTPLQGHLKLNF